MRNLVPGMEQVELSTPFCSGSVSAMRFKPWLNEDDPASVLFISSHGFGKKSRISKDEPSGPWFYPGSGATGENHLANGNATVAGSDAEAAATTDAIFDGLVTELSSMPEVPTMICGDFNGKTEKSICITMSGCIEFIIKMHQFFRFRLATINSPFPAALFCFLSLLKTSG